MVRPRAVSDSTIASIPSSRRCRLPTITGSKLPSRSRGTLNLHRADLGEHRLGTSAVARVAPVAPGRVVLVIAQVLAHLRLQGGLKHRLGQPIQQPARADQVDPFCTGPVHELLSELLLINLSRHGLDHLGHWWSFPPGNTRRVRPDQLHR